MAAKYRIIIFFRQILINNMLKNIKADGNETISIFPFESQITGAVIGYTQKGEIKDKPAIDIKFDYVLE